MTFLCFVRNLLATNCSRARPYQARPGLSLQLPLRITRASTAAQCSVLTSAGPDLCACKTFGWGLFLFISSACPCQAYSAVYHPLTLISHPPPPTRFPTIHPFTSHFYPPIRPLPPAPSHVPPLLPSFIRPSTPPICVPPSQPSSFPPTHPLTSFPPIRLLPQPPKGVRPEPGHQVRYSSKFEYREKEKFESDIACFQGHGAHLVLACNRR